jgi:hypothetical protein
MATVNSDQSFRVAEQYFDGCAVTWTVMENGDAEIAYWAAPGACTFSTPVNVFQFSADELDKFSENTELLLAMVLDRIRPRSRSGQPTSTICGRLRLIDGGADVSDGKPEIPSEDAEDK